MAAIRLLAGVTMRRHWRGILAVSLLVGIAGSVVLGAVAGARRTATAFGRFQEQSRAAHAEIAVGDATAAQLRAFRREESVGEIAALRQLTLVHRTVENLNVAGALDDRFGLVVDRARILSGRATDPSAVNEVSIGEALADQLGVGVGDTIPFSSLTQAQVDAFLSGRDGGQPRGPQVTLRVVGIHRRPLDLGARGEQGGVLVMTPAFVAEYDDQIGSFNGTILRVRGAHGEEDRPELAAAARRIFGDSRAFLVQPLGFDTEGARDAINVLTAALWIFAGIAGGATLVAIAIVLSRQVALTAGDQETLQALGLSRAQRVAVAGVIALPVAAGGAGLAAIGAALTSLFLPFGVAGRAEPHPGLQLDWLVLGVGVLAVALVVACVATLAAVRVTSVAARSTGATPRHRFMVPAATLRTLKPPTAIGLRMAFEPGHGRTAVPVRSALVGAALGAVGVVAALTFSSSLHELVTTPARYGWTWDLQMDDTAIWQQPNAVVCEDADTELVRARSLDAIAVICDLNIEVDGHAVIGYGFTSLRGTIEPTLVDGRRPRRPDEIALGASTLSAIGKSAGDRVRVRGDRGARTYRIVGRVVLPPQGNASDPQPPADGAVFSGTGLARLDEPGGNGNTNLLVRFAPGVDPTVATKRITDPELPGITVLARRPNLPVEVVRLRQLHWLPRVLAVFVGLLAVVAVGHALVTAVRRRRGDLAILKTMGFTRRQVSATVAWQATALSAAGLLVGVPVGLIVGRVVWGLVAEGLGVPTSATVPIVAVLATLVGGIVLGNLTAAVPARTAGRTRPAVVLRSE